MQKYQLDYYNCYYDIEALEIYIILYLHIQLMVAYFLFLLLIQNQLFLFFHPNQLKYFLALNLYERNYFYEFMLSLKGFKKLYSLFKFYLMGYLS